MKNNVCDLKDAKRLIEDALKKVIGNNSINENYILKVVSEIINNKDMEVKILVLDKKYATIIRSGNIKLEIKITNKEKQSEIITYKINIFSSNVCSDFSAI